MGVIAPHQQESVADARLGVLHESYGRHVLRYCRRHTGSDVEADDAFQVTFVQAMRALRGGALPHHELAWLLAIARNVCREQWRSHQRRPHLVDDLDTLPDSRRPSDTDRSIVLDFDTALAQLSERHRTAILLREWRGLSYAEIAAQMGATEPAVETMLVRARRELAAALEDDTQPKKRRASWRDLGWLAELARRIGPQGVGAKLATGAAVVAVTMSTGGSAPADSKSPGDRPASPAVAETSPRAEGGGTVTKESTHRSPAAQTATSAPAPLPEPTAAPDPRPTPTPPTAAPQQPAVVAPPPPPTNASPSASTPAESPPAMTTPVLSAQIPTLTVTVPSVALPDPLPSTPTMTVTTPAADIQTPTISVDLPGP